MALNRRKLKEWISRRTLSPPVAERFGLWHVGRHGLSLVCQLQTEGSSGEDWPDVIERQVSEEGGDHVAAWPGRQQYLVQAYRAGSDEAIGEYPFCMTATTTSLASTTVAVLDGETPEAEALSFGNLPPDFAHPHALVTTQQMRHTEALTRYVVELSMSSRERDGQIIAGQQRQIDEMQKGRLDIVDMLEGMLSRSQERSLVQQKWEKDTDRKDTILAKLLGTVIPEIARRSGIPIPADLLAEVKGLFMKLPEEVHSQILASLPDNDRQRLLDIFEGKTEQTEQTKH